MARQPPTPSDALPLHRQWLTELAMAAETTGTKLPEFAAGEGSPLAWARRQEIAEPVVAKATAQFLAVPYHNSLQEFRPAGAFVRRFPIGFARQHAVLGILDGEDLAVALPTAEAWPVLDMVGRLLGISPRALFAPREEILRLINQAYEQDGSQPDAVIDAISQEDGKSKLDSLEKLEDLLATDGQAPVVELVNLILLDAVKGGASDVHFQPSRDRLTVRYRIDGVLFDAHSLPKSVQEEALSRIKVMGKMNIAEKRLPQDGRATVTVGDRLIDLRIASLPGSYGERIVLRLLDKSARLYTLDDIGLNETAKRQIRQLITLEHGLILLTGPTGSGKTTTLYAALSEINRRDRNVVTLEDPIEYEIEGISQTQINVKKGLTFASGLRNVLRQDPDIIMVGEIRDNETAVMAIQAALTGHLVFSTLHTNDAASAVTRLLDLGIEPYLVSSSLLAVIAQRLVRKVCGHCAIEKPLGALAAELGIPNERESLYREGKGCPRCRETGYSGRVAICEVLVANEPIRGRIQSRASAADIGEVARRDGMRLLRDDGVEKVVLGITTPQEVSRVTVKTQQ